MNCKPGDLAIVVKSCAGNEGKIVRCIRINSYRSRLFNQWPNGISPPEIIWDIDVFLRGFDGTTSNYIADSQLKPIRPSDGEDEMLRIAGKPNEQKQAEVV